MRAPRGAGANRDEAGAGSARGVWVNTDEAGAQGRAAGSEHGRGRGPTAREPDPGATEDAAKFLVTALPVYAMIRIGGV